MGKLIVFAERDITAKGATPGIINETKLQEYFFEDDFHNLNLLDTMDKLTLSTATPILLYPGCGCDIFFPLMYVEKLFPASKQFKFIFVDVEDFIGIIKTMLDDVGISFAEFNNTLEFYWKDRRIELEFMTVEISTILEKLPTHHIYFERAFRIMKDAIPNYEPAMFQKLASGGILISDSGFSNVPLRIICVPQQLSSYGEMILGVKP